MSKTLERYVASLLLSAAGDALGFKNRNWEFCQNGQLIHEELQDLGGLEAIRLCLPKWRVSDDTVMHIATAEALIKMGKDTNLEKTRTELARVYKKCMNDMVGRSPGNTCSNALSFEIDKPSTYNLPFSKTGGGCGAAMRAMCIGLKFWRPEELKDLISVSVESGRLTHHHPTAFLGSYVAALFVSYALQEKPVQEWGAAMVATLPQVWEYIKSRNIYVNENLEAASYFEEQWKGYLKLRKIEDGTTEPVFPPKYGVEERDAFYSSISFYGWGGASGHDATIIAYDALLGCKGSWEELCYRGVLHGGDSDSTGAIAGAWFGAIHGLDQTIKCHYQFLEYKSRLADLAVELFKLAHPGELLDTSNIELAPTFLTNRSVLEDNSDGEGECRQGHCNRLSSGDS